MNRISKAILICTLALVAVTSQAKTLFNFAAKDGTNLHGEYYASPNPTAFLLVLHGLQSHSGWYNLGDYYAQNGISSLIYDRRGSGLSDGLRGHADSVDDFMNDMDSAFAVLKKYNKDNLPVHVLANSLGGVLALTYLSSHNVNVASLILSTPGTNSTALADYSVFTKGLILISPAKNYFDTPLKDEFFVDPGAYLDWIKNDTLGDRKFTAAFLRAVNTMRSNIGNIIPKLNIPLFLMLAKSDQVIDNPAVEKDVYTPYKAEKKLSYYDSKHYLFFGNDQDSVKNDIKDWILQH